MTTHTDDKTFPNGPNTDEMTARDTRLFCITPHVNRPGPFTVRASFEVGVRIEGNQSQKPLKSKPREPL
jgi:hypothetical protein